MQVIDTCGPNIIRKTNIRHSKKYAKNGWSPEVRALCAQLQCMIEIRRQMCGFHGRKKWTGEEAVRDGVEKHLNKWIRVVDSLKWASSEAKQAVLGITGKPPDFLMDPHVNLVDLVEHEIPKLLKKMPGRLRTAKYREISEHTRLRDQRVKEGKIGQAIRSLVGKPPMFFDTSAMRTSPDHLELNPLKIFGAISDNFVDWHSPLGMSFLG